VLGVFGSRSLGIFTTVSDVAQWQRLFDVDIKFFDESSIVEKAKKMDDGRVKEYKEWLLGQLQSCEYGELFTPEALDRQIRSYLSLRDLVEENRLDFVGNKCQRELSDGYTTQCLAHMMLNSTGDILGGKRPTVHACESDTDGALTMRLLSLLSGGKAAALMDVRYLDTERNMLALANCGAIANDFYCKEDQRCGLTSVKAVPHAFGAAGGCAFSGIMEAGPVTLARLCRKNGRYWMAIIKGEVVIPENGELDSITPQFPKGLIKVNLDEKFLNEFGSNHLHVVRGDYLEELETFCKLKSIEFQTWK
jgi:L-fucose isomerase